MLKKINTILMCLVKFQVDPDIVTAFASFYDKLTDAGQQPKHHVPDNECSRAVQ